MAKKKVLAQGVKPRKHLTQRLKILVVDDSLHVRRQLVDALQAHGVSVAPDAATAKRMITAERPHICFIDLDLGDPNDGRSGLPVIAAAKRSGAYAVVLTNYDDAETRDLADRMGCDEFHSKREGLQSVPATISRYLSQRGSY